MRPLERPRHRWEVTIKRDIKETEWGCMYCVHLAQDRDQYRDAVKINYRVPCN
jgi:hypothetical protein